MAFTVRLSRAAVGDLEALHEYVATHDSPLRADELLTRIMHVFASLAETPERGAFPAELLTLGVRDFRQVYFKPYRILYEVVGDAVDILLIADGRRDVRTLLQRRLLGR